MKEKADQETESEGKMKHEALDKFWQLNIQGLITNKCPRDKVNLLRETVYEEKPLCLALTETWLHDHREAEVHIEDYIVFRKDRPLRKKKKKNPSRGRHVGGVALYVNSSWLPDSKEILEYSNAVVDVMAIHSKRENIIIAVLYRQPENRKCTHRMYRSTYEDFVEPLKYLDDAITKYKNPDTEVMILGDFNMPSADWDLGSHKEGALEDQIKLVANTQELCDKFLLQQIITTSTHCKGNMLDLVFTNYPDRIHSQNAKKTALSDHYIVEFYTNQTEKFVKVPDNTKQKGSDYGFHMLNLQDEEIDWVSLGKACKTDWKEMLKGKSEREKKTAFHNHCLEKAYEYIPKKSRPPNKRKKCIPRDRRILMRRRTKVYKQISKNPCNEKLKEKIVEIEKQLLDSHQKEKKNTEEKVIKACKKNRKYFFSYAKKCSKVKQNIGPIIDWKGDMKSNPKDMSKIINT